MRRYFVRRSQNLIEPEEILLDEFGAKAERPERMEFSVPENALRTFLFVGLFGLFFVAGYTLYLQTFRFPINRAAAATNRLRLVFSDAPRGTIYDRFGEVLAANKEIFNVAALPLALPSNDIALKDIAGRLAPILGMPADDLERELDAARKSPYAEPLTIKEDVLRSAALAIEDTAPDLPGIKLIGAYERQYPDGAAFSHVLGYTGGISKDELRTISGAAPGDFVGRAGVEASYDGYLRGEKGKEELEVNASLDIVDTRRASVPIAGQDLYLTLDAGLQKALYRIITAYLASYGYERAAAVAIHPKTGEVLALVSVPSFDNNLFAAGISSREYDRLLKNPATPLIDRAISGIYSPGSTVKPLLAAAALEERIVMPTTLIDDTKGQIEIPNPYDPTKVSIFRDWKAHGWVDIRNAIAKSANVFFYVIGGGYQGREGLGITRIAEYFNRFGFGEPTGIALAGEASGLVPDPEWKAKARPQDPYWRLGDTYITSIGQGDVLVTPLQLAMAHAAIANGGMLLTPQLVRSIGIRPEEVPSAITITREMKIAPENLKVVQEGMRLTTAEGSARSLSMLPFVTAGKTGTVQVTGGKTNAVFSVYGPAEDPVIELVVIVENGGEGSSTAVPIAREVLSWYWENRLKNGGIMNAQ